LKIKIECSGYEGSEDEKDEYIKRIFDHTGIVIDKENINENAGMKSIAKIMLNSLWGKFGQRDELISTEYFTDPSKWYRILDKHESGELMIKNETMIDNNTLYVQYISKDTRSSSLNTTNLGLAAFVTGQARLRLYSELNKLKERVIYCDTDSIYYHYDETKYNIPDGDLLGTWENEHPQKGNDVHGRKLVEMNCLAPKSYGYRSVNDMTGSEWDSLKMKKIVKEVSENTPPTAPIYNIPENGYVKAVSVKCKGVTLNHKNLGKFNFGSLGDLITGKVQNIVTEKLEFVKDKKKGTIYYQHV
jgi:hypothetical protein